MSIRNKAAFKAAVLVASAIIAVAVNCSTCQFMVSAASLIKGTVAVEALNVRKGPGTDKPIINVIYKGDSVEISKTEKGWYKIVQSRNQYGWVSSDYITTGKAKKANTAQTPKCTKTVDGSKKTTAGKSKETVTVTGTYVNLRKGAGTDYPVIKKYIAGQLEA